MLINQLKSKLRFENILLQTISTPDKLCANKISVLRLDLLDPHVSGNKWFKLQYYLANFFTSKKRKLATFGGAYSNHIAATAMACKRLDIPCIGFIRGEEPKMFSKTLSNAQQNGMELVFLSRDTYRDKEKIVSFHPDYYWVPEGGYGLLGVQGAADIWNYVPQRSSFDKIILPVGSGTSIAGILDGCMATQEVLGISVMKNNFSLKEEIKSLVGNAKIKQLKMVHGYDFGGYAKKTPELLSFMNNIWTEYQLPLDFVYTAKAFYGLMNMLEQKEIALNSNILFLHTGGLQGNASLPPQTLIY